MKKPIFCLLTLLVFTANAHATPLFYDRANVEGQQFLKDDTNPELYYQLPERFETYSNKWASDRGSLAIWVKARAIYNEAAAAELQRQLGGRVTIERITSALTPDASHSPLFAQVHCEEAPSMEISCLLVLAEKTQRIAMAFPEGRLMAVIDTLFTVQALDSFGKLSRYEHAPPVQVFRPGRR